MHSEVESLRQQIQDLDESKNYQDKTSVKGIKPYYVNKESLNRMEELNDYFNNSLVHNNQAQLVDKQSMEKQMHQSFYNNNQRKGKEFMQLNSGVGSNYTSFNSTERRDKGKKKDKIKTMYAINKPKEISESLLLKNSSFLSSQNSQILLKKEMSTEREKLSQGNEVIDK